MELLERDAVMARETEEDSDEVSCEFLCPLGHPFGKRLIIKLFNCMANQKSKEMARNRRDMSKLNTRQLTKFP